ncbi:MAG: hydroxyacid dehydrogenase [Calditrichota bacterium]
MSYRVFLTGSGIAAEAVSYLESEGCIVEVGDPRDSSEDLIRKFTAFNPDGIIVRQGKITAEVQDAAPNLKIISKHGVGTDNIDKEAATQRGIPVTYTPSANFEAVAQHTLALILSLVRRLYPENIRIRQGIFDKKTYDGEELTGKTLGLIGYGNIARHLAKLVAPLGMNVVTYDPFITSEELPAHISKVDSPEAVFSRSDILSVHSPLTPETQNLVNKTTIAAMKSGGYIINTARGGIVNEADLYEALQSGHLAGAALDAFEKEPPEMDNPLFKLDNIIFTTHIGGMSNKSFRNMGFQSSENLLTVLKGEQLHSSVVVNKDVL